MKTKNIDNDRDEKHESNPFLLKSGKLYKNSTWVTKRLIKRYPKEFDTIRICTIAQQCYYYNKKKGYYIEDDQPSIERIINKAAQRCTVDLIHQQVNNIYKTIVLFKGVEPVKFKHGV